MKLTSNFHHRLITPDIQGKSIKLTLNIMVKAATEGTYCTDGMVVAEVVGVDEVEADVEGDENVVTMILHITALEVYD